MTAPIGTPTEVFATDRRWLKRQPLAENTRRTCRVQVAQFCAHLAPSPQDAGDPLRQRHAATYAVRDYRPWLSKAKPRSVNLTLAALDHFYRFLGLDRPDVPREDLPQAAPSGLEEQEQADEIQRIVRRWDAMRARTAPESSVASP